MRLLVIRTSAMGDVALVTPVLREMNKRFPEVEITLVTRSLYKSFFSESDFLSVFSPDFQNRHKGFIGLIRLYGDLKKVGKIDYVIDIHDVIRSKILKLLFRIGGVPVSVIDKHTVIRYCNAFSRAGFNLEPADKQNIIPSASAFKNIGEILNFKINLNIGVAPYALHKLKMWPQENMIRLLNMISENHKVSFFLFGGKGESDQLEEFKKEIRFSINLAGKLSLEEELAVISRLDFMIAMDSSNMHMAALVGTKTISIWGGTDPLNGFGAWMQPDEYSIRIPVDELTCRPCTIYGKGECRRGDLACMNRLTPEIVYNRMDQMKLF
jgi:ADP-heptose:LPS heptosyltransferase